MAAGRTLQDLFSRLPSYGNRAAVGLRREFGLRWLSYRELHTMSLRAAALLAEAGVGRGDHVLVRAPNSPEWAAFLFGAFCRGAVVVPVDVDAPLELVERVADEVSATVLVSTLELPELGASLPSIRLESLYERAAAVPEDLIEPLAPEDPAIVFYTSGTTSKPRGVVLTHGNLMSQLVRFRSWRWLVRQIPFRIVVVAPMSHAQGVIVGIFIPLTVGLSAIYTHSSHPGQMIRILRDNRVTLLSTVPRSLQMLTRAFVERPYGRSGETLGDKLMRSRRRFVRRHYIFTAMRRILGYRFWVVLVGGAPLPEADERFWRDSGSFLVQGYGLTETASLISITPPIFGGFGSVGKPLANQDVKIAEDGEILVRGPNVMPGYLGRTSAADVSFGEDGYLRTGDLGKLDRRDRLYILGRKKEVIITGEGFNVNAGDLEEVLNGLPGVRDSVVLGLEQQGHTRLHAVLLLERGAAADELVRRANERLVSYQRIHGWSVWPEDDFPRGQLLKIRRREVAEWVARRRPNSPSAVRVGDALPSLEEIQTVEDKDQRLDLLARYVAEGAPGTSSDARLSLVQDLGLGSLDVVELLFRLERHSGAFLEDVVVDEEITLGELGSLVENPYRGPSARSLRTRNPPRWAELPFLDPLRRLVNPLVMGGLLRLRARVRVEGLEHLEGLSSPVILAGTGHEHAIDVLLVYCSLPRRLRRRIAVIASRWVFGHFLDPEPGVPRSHRLLVALGFELVVPLFFPLALTPSFGTAREGLMEACRLIDRGYSPIAFEGQGIGVIAKQTGVPIVPVHLAGNQEIDFVPRGRRPEVSVRFGEPLASTPDVPQEKLIEALTALFPD